MRHAVHRIKPVMILLLSAIFLSILFFLNRDVLLANGKLSGLYIRNKRFPKDITLVTNLDRVDLWPPITGSWDVYFYDLRHEKQIVGLLLLQKNRTYTVEFFPSIEDEIRDALRTNLFILRVSQGTYQCTILDSKSRQNLPFADEETIADCLFTTKYSSGRRMVIKLINVQGSPRLFWEYSVEPGAIRNWSIEKPVTAQ